MMRPAVLCALLSALILPADLSARESVVYRQSLADVRDAIAARGLDPSQVAIPFALPDEVLAWADAARQPGIPPDTVVQILLRKLQDPAGSFAMQYDRGYTGTAAEVFEQGRYNCLGFSNLFIGLARSLGLDAYFLRVDAMRRYGQEGSFVIASNHVTAAYGPLSDRTILEFGIEGEQGFQSARRISDLQAIAMYYTNRGTEHLRGGDATAAIGALELALDLDPVSADAWLNLGVARRRQGDLDGAEAAYHHALDHNPELVSAYFNLAALYRLRGDPREADKVLTAVDEHSHRNPYIYLALGDMNMAHGAPLDAERYYRRAVKLKASDQEIQAALGLWALQYGKLREARRRLQRAASLDGASPRMLRLSDGIRAALRADDEVGVPAATPPPEGPFTNRTVDLRSARPASS